MLCVTYWLLSLNNNNEMFRRLLFVLKIWLQTRLIGSDTINVYNDQSIFFERLIIGKPRSKWVEF